MTEVSCRVFDIHLRDLKRRKLDPSHLVEGVDCTIEDLSNKEARVSWTTYRHIMSNGRRYWSDEQLKGLGGAFFKSPLIRSFSLIGRLLFDVRTFYKWYAMDRSGGIQFFTCFTTGYEDLGNGALEVRLINKPGYEPCREFFLVCQGVLTHLPTLFGANNADVVLDIDQSVGKYSIRLPRITGFLPALRRLIIRPFAIYQAAGELRSANDALHQRYELLVSAQRKLDEQARQLRTANEITRLIHGDINLDSTANSITKALVEIAGFAGARLNIWFRSSEADLRRDSEHGATDGEYLTLEIAARGNALGTLDVWSGSANLPDAESNALLENLLPSICMALDESIAFTLVNQYRASLEQRVADRTAELEKARDSLAQTVQDLEAAQSVRNKIFANINHEIRTPLSLVLLAAGELRTRHASKSDPKTIASVTNIEAACERLLSMVDSMLLLAAGQEGKLRVKRRDCDLAIETRRIVSIWQPLATQHKLLLDYSGPERVSSYLDTAALERVLANLISNAIKYTPDGGSIEVSIAERGDGSEVAVRDTGIGVDDEFRKRIFGRFEQGRAAVRHGARSSGIGLSIVKELVEAHQGTVSVEANRGGGTIFRAFFPTVAPLERTDSPDEKSSVSSHNLPAGFGLQVVNHDSPVVLVPEGGAKATALVAEDDHGLRASVGELLFTAGYKVLLAPDGFSALRLAAEHFPDILVSDVGMPGMDGLELSRRFRDLPGNRLAPVLLLTAYGTTTDKLSGFEAGAIDYITKPFEPKELIARVQSQLMLRDMALRLSQTEKLASLGTMSAGLAHEMRNPANGLLNALDPLQSLLPPECNDPESATGQLMDVIRDCAQQLGRLSKQLLGFKNESEMTCTDEDVEHLVRRALSMVTASRDVDLRLRYTYTGRVRCAAPMMVQVLVNVIDNAVQAAGTGGWVEVTTRVDSDHVIFDVADSGPGVPAKLRERIFDPFFTTKAPGAGTGLGLSTSRHIVQQHYGTVHVVEGTTGTFRIELPLNGPSVVSVATNSKWQPRPQQAAS